MSYIDHYQSVSVKNEGLISILNELRATSKLVTRHTREGVKLEVDGPGGSSELYNILGDAILSNKAVIIETAIKRLESHVDTLLLDAKAEAEGILTLIERLED